MFVEAQLVFKSYKPLKLEVGMLFLIQGQYETYLHKLEKMPIGFLTDEDYFREYGYPVEMYIIDPGNPNLDEEVIIATPEQIGWFDKGDSAESVSDITLKNINRIISGYDGYLLVEMFEDDEDEDYLYPILYDNKVTIRYSDLEDEYDDNDADVTNDEENKTF